MNRRTYALVCTLAALSGAGCGNFLRGAMLDPGTSASAGQGDAGVGSDGAGAVGNEGSTGNGDGAASDGSAGNPAQVGSNVDVPAANNVSDRSTLSCQANLASSAYVKCGGDEKLTYVADAQTGAPIMDFSGAGYRGGGKLLPTLPVRQTLRPSGGDDTTAIQNALNAVSALAADANGWRGRVLLGPGTYTVSKTLTLKSSGVSLEGTASQGPQASTIKLAGSANVLVAVAGSASSGVTGSSYAVKNVPVVAGSTQLTLASVDGLKVGDAVRVSSYRNNSWITMVWGGSYPPVRDGATQAAWGSEMTLKMSRTLTAIAGSTITLDAPLPDTLPAASYATPTGATVQKETATGYVREVGFAHLNLVGRYVAGDISVGLLVAFTVNAAEDVWFDDIQSTDFGNGTVSLTAQTRNVTIQDVRHVRTQPQDGSAKPFDFTLYGQKILVQGCASSGNKTFYACHQTATATGPHVIQNYRVTGAGTFEPHQRWSTGILFDNIYVPAGGVALKDRGIAGSGHGWGQGFSVAYNSLAGTTNTSSSGMDALPGHTIDQPPGSYNLGIGLVGPNRSAVASQARYDSPGAPVGPASLWAHQLWQRLGDEALDTVVGPWHVTLADGGNCLAANGATVGATLASEDCDAAGARAVFDITSRGAVRLGGTALCLDAGTATSNAAVTLQACSDAASQLFATQSRAGYRTVLALKASTSSAQGSPTSCVNVAGSQAVVGACDYNAGPLRLLVTHLAR